MAIGGTYRITAPDGTTYEFPAPTTQWSPSVLGAGLNGLPKICSYRQHEWTWPGNSLEPCDFKNLLELWNLQNSSGLQLSALETDDADAEYSVEKYGTCIYTDFVISEISGSRGLPNFDSPRVLFEVYVG